MSTHVIKTVTYLDDELVGEYSIDVLMQNTPVDNDVDVANGLVAYVVNPNGVNVRSGPDTTYRKVSALPASTRLVVSNAIYEDDFAWRQILDYEAGGIVGNFIAELGMSSAPNGLAHRRFINILRDFVTLDVEWVSQLGPNATGANDCGQACVAMLVNYHTGLVLRPDQISSVNSGRTTAAELRTLARHFDYRSASVQSFNDIHVFVRETIDHNKPAILLVDYETMPFIPHIKGTAGLHWLMLVGYSTDGKEYLIHDPLWLANGINNGNNGNSNGAFLRVYAGDLRTALRANYAVV